MPSSPVEVRNRRGDRRAKLRADGLNVAILDVHPSDDEFRPRRRCHRPRRRGRRAERRRARLGPISVLVNAAGLDCFTRFTEVSFDRWRVIDVNLNGVFHCIRRYCEMIEAGWGRIVNISASSSTPLPARRMWRLRRREVHLSERSDQDARAGIRTAGITVNAVPPGFPSTPRAARRRRQRVTSATSTRPSRRRRCAASAAGPKDIAAACARPDLEEAGYHHRSNPSASTAAATHNERKRTVKFSGPGRQEGRVRHRRRARQGRGRGPAGRKRRRHHRGRSVSTASSSIGYAMATPEDLDGTRGSSKTGRRIVTAQADVRIAEQLRARSRRGLAELGKVDIVVGAGRRVAGMKGNRYQSGPTSHQHQSSPGTINAIQVALCT